LQDQTGDGLSQEEFGGDASAERFAERDDLPVGEPWARNQATAACASR